MGLNLDYNDGQTPLDDDEKEGLLIPTITTRGELDEFEQLGIETAFEWLLRKRLEADLILTQDFVKELHMKMFQNVWRWAGEFRLTNKNLGVDKYQIAFEIRNLLDDCRYWIEKKTFCEDEIAVRLSHRMVVIHPFANGNGRHSRMLADVLINKGFGKQYFSWGRADLARKGDARSLYLSALREADNMNYAPLIKFARS